MLVLLLLPYCYTATATATASIAKGNHLQSHSNKKFITQTKVKTEAIPLLIALFNIAVPTYRSSLTLCDRLSGAQTQSRSFIGEEHNKKFRQATFAEK